jgi:hypothetical protein
MYQKMQITTILMKSLVKKGSEMFKNSLFLVRYLLIKDTASNNRVKMAKMKYNFELNFARKKHDCRAKSTVIKKITRWQRVKI